MGSTFVTTPVALALCFMDLGLHFESGVVHGVANTSDDWNLHEVEDESALRFWTTKVIFKKAFTSKPRIFVAFALLDLLNDSVDYRVATEPIEIANHSFKVKVSTWSDSKVWSVKVSWFAYPEVYEGYEAFHKNDEHYTLADGSGPRMTYRQFLHASLSPSFFYGFSKIDMIETDVLRIGSTIDKAAPSTYHIKLSTWGDSKVWAATINWLLIDTNQLLTTYKMTAGANNIKLDSTSHHASYTLGSGTGSRKLKHFAKYDKPSTVIPANMITAISGFVANTENKSDMRFGTCIESPSPSAMEVAVSTWNQSVLPQAAVSYLYLGAWSGPMMPIPLPYTAHKPSYSGIGGFGGFGYHHHHAYDEDEYYSDEEEDDYPIPVVPVPKALAKPAAPKPALLVNGEPPTKKVKTAETDSTATTEIPPAPAENEEEKICKVCFDNKIDTVMIPCGHLCVCTHCATAILAGHTPKCPICSQKLENVVKTFVA